MTLLLICHSHVILPMNVVLHFKSLNSLLTPLLFIYLLPRFILLSLDDGTKELVLSLVRDDSLRLVGGGMPFPPLIELFD